MRGRFAIIHYHKQCFKKSKDSHLCTNIVMLGISFFSLKVLCDYISAFKRETDMGFMVMIIIIRFFPFSFCHC